MEVAEGWLRSSPRIRSRELLLILIRGDHHYERYRPVHEHHILSRCENSGRSYPARVALDDGGLYEG
jgi:hypothetical protein